MSEGEPWGDGLNRGELQVMSMKRIRDAGVLLRGGRWEFAYYAAGYSVECALKSCLLKRMTETAWVFDEKWNANQCLTHDFAKLIKLAGLNGELNARQTLSSAGNGLFVAHWGRALQWSVQSRYEPRTQDQAAELYAAIIHKPDGVLRWIRNFW